MSIGRRATGKSGGRRESPARLTYSWSSRRPARQSHHPCPPRPSELVRKTFSCVQHRREHERQMRLADEALDAGIPGRSLGMTTPIPSRGHTAVLAGFHGTQCLRAGRTRHRQAVRRSTAYGFDTVLDVRFEGRNGFRVPPTPNGSCLMSAAKPVTPRRSHRTATDRDARWKRQVRALPSRPGQTGRMFSA